MESARKHVPAPPAAHVPHAAQPAIDEVTRSAEPRRRRKPFLVLGAIAAVVVVGLGAWSWINSGKESTDDAQIEADVVPIASRVPGMVKRVAVVENQRVKKGDLLVELDSLDLLTADTRTFNYNGGFVEVFDGKVYTHRTRNEVGRFDADGNEEMSIDGLSFYGTGHWIGRSPF